MQFSFDCKAWLAWLVYGFLLLDTCAAHGAITGATGDQGGQGFALGIDPATPRDGTRRRPFQQDTTVFEKANRRRATTSVSGCGKTLEGGTNDVTQGIQDVMTQNDGLPQVSAGGSLTMTLHQVNADGAGPYTCMLDTTGTAESFQPIQVSQNVAGRNGLSVKGSKANHTLVADMPADMQCTGTSGSTTGICMVRCQNPARAGPFGGCVPVQQVDASTATSTNNATASGTASQANERRSEALSTRRLHSETNNEDDEDDDLNGDGVPDDEQESE